ncbi:MAG: hypothetical protein R2813_04645 [Flavobacteriales bacterium]
MKTLIRILGALVLLFALFMTWYWFTHRMRPAVEFKIGSDDAPQSLLIAYQGSNYKNNLTAKLCTHYSTSDVVIKGIDVDKLPEIDPDEWTAILILHTWEVWRAPEVVAAFHLRTIGANNIVYFTTSGDGSYHFEDVDAVTSASLIEDLEKDAQNAIIHLEAIID